METRKDSSTSSTAADSLQLTDAKKEDDNVNFFYDLISAPCFRQSTLYGIGGGAAIGALQFTRSRDLMRSAETMVKTGCGISLLTWIACRRQYYVQREMTYETLNKYRDKTAAQAAARAKQMREKSASSSATQPQSQNNKSTENNTSSDQ